jgi:transposase
VNVLQNTELTPSGSIIQFIYLRLAKLVKKLFGFKIKTKMGKKTKTNLAVINQKAAGIDIGAKEHYVCVPSHLTEISVREFGTFTEDLTALGDWLVDLGIQTVAMESTGIYWLSLFEILEAKGLEVCLVNARHLKNVRGRKSDVSDCQWIQQLHSYGLLSASFIPEDHFRALRAYVRQRSRAQTNKAQHLQYIGKALQLMNIKLGQVLSNIETQVGMRIIREIAEGETSAEQLARHHTTQMKADKATLIKSLVGNFRAEHLFALNQALAGYDFFKAQMQACEEKIEACLQGLENPERVPSPEQSRPKTSLVRQNQYSFQVKTYLQNILGTDLTAVPGLEEDSLLSIIAEVGTDLSKWASAKHFTAWLGLAPNPQISGKKVIGQGKQKVKNRAKEAFQLAAWSLHASNSPLGQMYRRISYRRGATIAVKAIARKLAVIFYQMISQKQAYQPSFYQGQEEKIKQMQIKKLQKKAQKLGLSLQKIE